MDTGNVERGLQCNRATWDALWEGKRAFRAGAMLGAKWLGRTGRLAHMQWDLYSELRLCSCNLGLFYFFIHSFDKYALRTLSMPGTARSSKNKLVNKASKVSCSRGANKSTFYSEWG